MNKYIDSVLSLFRPKYKTADTIIDVEVVKPGSRVVDGIQIGAIYRLQKDITPFDHLQGGGGCHAKVKDIKEGWVLYALLNQALKEGGMFQNETMKADTFRNIYKLTNL